MHHTLCAALVACSAGVALAEDAPALPEFDSPRALFEALETADAEIDTFEAKIQYDRVFILQQDRHTRLGDLAFAVDRAGERPTRAFAVTFDTLIVDDKASDEDEHYVFDGRWYVEKHASEKQFIRREVAPPGSDFDPLALGEGPFPIPIGQKAESILARYDAALTPVLEPIEHDPSYRSFVEGRADELVCVVLTPKNEEDDNGFRRLALWYERESLLPVLARTTVKGGDLSFVRLIGKRVNDPGFDAGVIDVNPPDEPGWSVQIDEGQFVREEASP